MSGRIGKGRERGERQERRNNNEESQSKRVEGGVDEVYHKCSWGRW